MRLFSSRFPTAVLAVVVLASTHAHAFGKKRQPAPRPVPVPAFSGEFDLRVLTYNVWGLPVPKETAPWRYAEIGRRLAQYDIVAFQETWSTKTKAIMDSGVHPYRAFGGNPHGLVGGSGLIVLSKYPITRTYFEAYHDCVEWECATQKGVLMFRVAVKPGVEVDFYQTHMHAWERHDLTRTGQILQLMGVVHEQSIGRPIVVLGDFNSDYRSLNYDELVGGLYLRDSYEEYVRRLKDPTEEQRLGYTFDIVRNPWAVPDISGETRPQRLDYIFYLDTGGVRMRTVESALAFTEPVRDGKPLSDHYGLTTLFRFNVKQDMGMRW